MCFHVKTYNMQLHICIYTKNGQNMHLHMQVPIANAFNSVFFKFGELIKSLTNC